MGLDVQIYSFLSSFIYGLIFYFLLELLNILVKNVKLVFKFIISFLFIIIVACLYFIMLLFINNGVVHIYFILMVLVGYIFSYKVLLRVFTYFLKK